MTQKETFHIDLLKSAYGQRHAHNAAYSLRSFSRDLKISPSLLSALLNGKKGISKVRAKQISRFLGLSTQDEKLFLLSVQASHSRAQIDKVKAREALKSIKQTYEISEQELNLANNWYHQAILELCDLDECKHTTEWFVKKLNLPKAIVSSALERLQNLGWLEIKQNKYKATHQTTTTTHDISVMAIKELHVQMLDQAKQALFTQTIKEREFSNITMAIDANLIKEAKEELREFQIHFAKKYSTKSKNKNSVYQLAAQFFRLDQKG